MPELERTAYVDESFHEHPERGFYVLAAAIFDPDPDAAREAMLALRGSRRRIDKLHWSEMGPAVQRKAASVVAGLGAAYLVTVGTPVRPRRRERARALSLRRLVFELHARGVTRLMMESRQDRLDADDRRTVISARYDLPKGTTLQVEHALGAVEPLFWVADIVAGAVRAAREGDPVHRETLGDSCEVLELLDLRV
jgi:hypothetical protein